MKKKLYKIYQKDKTRMNIYTPNHTVLKYINQQLTEENYINQIFI